MPGAATGGKTGIASLAPWSPLPFDPQPTLTPPASPPSCAIHCHHLAARFTASARLLVRCYIARPTNNSSTMGRTLMARTRLVAAVWSRRRKVYNGSESSGGENELLDPALEPARTRPLRPSLARRRIGRAILQHPEQCAATEGFRRLQLVERRRAGNRIYD
jgi:hypothetical protein